MEANSNPLSTIISRFHPLAAATQEDLNDIIQFRAATKNEMLLEMDHVATNMYFVQKGLARVFYYHDGKEITDYFAIDEQFIGAVPSLITQQPTKKAIQLVENAELYYFSMKAFDDCCARHHDLERAARKLIAFAILEEQERIESLRFYSARERYELMEKKYPGITNRCPLQYIASYIGTTQVSISRIRAGQQ